MESWKNGCLVLDEIELNFNDREMVALPYDTDHILACDSAKIANDAIKKMVGDA